MTLLLPLQSRKDRKIPSKKPPPAKSSPKPVNSHQTSFSNVTSSILEGMSFGTGSAIGHTIVNKVSGFFSKSENETGESKGVSKVEKTETKVKQSSCEEFLKKFENCNNNYGSSSNLEGNNCDEIFREYEKCKEK